MNALTAAPVRVPLRTVASFNPSPLQRLNASEEVSFVPMASVSEDGRIAVKDHLLFHELKQGFSYMQHGDVLVAKITPCYENNKIAVVNIDRRHGFGSTEFHVIRADKNILSPKYLSYYLRQDHIREAGERRMTGSGGQRRVPRQFLEELAVPLPSLDEQQRIAAILDQADDLRRMRQKSLIQAAILADNIFGIMFGQPETNPNSFTMLPMGDLIASGPTNGLYKPSSAYGNGTPILRINNFYDGRIVNIADLRRLTITESEAKNYDLRQNDIVINRVNSREFVGKSAIVPALPEPTVFESNIMRVRLDRSRVEPEYAIAFLQTDFIKRQIASCMKDAVNQSSINQQDVRSFMIMLPPIADQQRFIERIGALRAIEKAQHAHLDQLDSLFASLQHRAFRGEL